MVTPHLPEFVLFIGERQHVAVPRMLELAFGGESFFSFPTAGRKSI